MTASQQSFNLNLSRKRLDRLGQIADDEGLTVKQLILRLIDEAWEDFEAGADDDDLIEQGRRLASETELG
jgi:predicted DNA-binding ribbon-helix-helix protein